MHEPGQHRELNEARERRAPHPDTLAFEPGFEPVRDAAALVPSDRPEADAEYEPRPEIVVPPLAPIEDEAGHDFAPDGGALPQWPDDDEISPLRRPAASPRLAEIFVINPAGSQAKAAATFDRLDRLVKDIAEITQAREMLLAEGRPQSSPAALAPLTSRPIRTADSVPIILGSTIGLLMMMLIGVAALFANFAR